MVKKRQNIQRQHYGKQQQQQQTTKQTNKGTVSKRNAFPDTKTTKRQEAPDLQLPSSW